MEFGHIAQIEKRKESDILVIPFWKGKKHGEWAVSLSPSLTTSCFPALESGDFKGKEGETLFLYLKDQPEKRAVLLGLGANEKISTEILRRCYGSLLKACLSRKFQALNVIIPKIDALTEDSLVSGISEGLLLPNYPIERYKQQDSEELDPPVLLKKVILIGPYKHALTIAEKCFAIAEGVYYARDLVNGNADDITPQYLEACARGLANQFPHLKVTLFDKKRIEKEKMGLLLAVNRGSHLDPAFIIMEYKGNPKSKDHTVIVGKGITYDTGGLNIKTVNMETMKCDMGGGAACFGTIIAACNLQLKTNITVVIPSTENSVDAKSFKPGDVYISYLGKSVEMTNSDAEGRLVLADALAYAVAHLHPTRLIDIATLTGGIDVALGAEATGLMSNDDALSNALVLAGANTFERLWRMPLYDEYREKLKSDIADMKSWNGRSATSCVAAMFIKEFTGNIPWAHLDIASTAYMIEPKKYQPKYATGVGVRLMIEFLENLIAEEG
ncbi:MAG: leucyl aminopeptidase [Parachlamydiaceae bacterium]|nr:leucyl aminopeptidase [Parachlamydiaceae bacterium]